MLELNLFNHPICRTNPKRLTLSGWQEHIPFAMLLVELLKPKIIVELGTAYGESYCAFCQAVKALNLDTLCYAIDTWQGDPQTGFYGPEVLSDLRSHHDYLYGSFSRLIQSTFDEALPHFADGTIDILHIDGYHIYEMVKHDFESWLPKVSFQGVVLLHDTNVLEGDYGVRRFWDEIKRKYYYFEFLHGQGLGVLSAGKVQSEELQALLEARGEKAAAIRSYFFHLGHRLSLEKEKDDQIAILMEKDDQIANLEENLKAKDSQIRDLESQIRDLESQMEQIHRSIVVQFMSRYQRVIDKLLRPGTRRRYYYELGLTGIRVILNEGWKSFFRKVKLWFQLRKTILRRHMPSLPRFKASISRKEAKKLVFPEPSQKLGLSIIIPAYNNWQYTVHCLKSICENTDGDYEVIVVDDASTDETAKVLSEVNNLCLIRNKQNAGFIESCNHGAKESKGEYVLFLNNDTMVTKNWLPPLFEIIVREDVGAAGSKLVYPNGKLQEAGSIVWNDGSCWNYGRGYDPDEPEYNYVREIDYCSGACLLVKRELFEKIGGFDKKFKPGYYEDTDLCLSIRNLGYKVMYQPLSVIVHLEGITSGTSTSSGIKRYQEINKPKFAEKWNAVLQKHHYSPGPENLFLARDKRLGQRILVMDHYVPTYDRDSGSLRMFNMLKILVELGNKVTFIGDEPLRMEPYTQELQQKGIEVIYAPYIQSMKEYLAKNGKLFDIAILSRAHVAAKHISSVKRYCNRAEIVFDTVDLQFLRKSRRAEVENSEVVLEEAERLKRLEFQLARMSDITFVVSPVEKDIMLKEDPSLRIEVVSNIHQIKHPQKGFSERRDIMFVGGFVHPPNGDAVEWFAREIFPLIREKIPAIKFYVVGNEPPREITRLNSSDIIVTGYVEDLTPYFKNCKLFVSPLRYGAGVKGKINQSMSYGLPVVTTSIGAEGIGLTDSENALIADNPEEFAEKVALLYNDEELWNRLSENSIKNVEENFSYGVIKEKLKKVFYNLNTCGQKSDVLSEMHTDWNKRAKEDFKHYISYSQTEEEFEESGKRHVDDFVTPDLELIADGIDPKKMRILEIGCGAGRMTKYLGELFGEVHGVDISDEMISLAQDRLKSISNVHLYCNNGQDLSMFPDNYFDFAFSYIVFQHIPEKEVIINYIKEAHRVLKPNRIFKFQVQGYLGEEYLKTKKDTWLGVSFSQGDIEQIANSLNFEVITMSGQGTQYFWITLKKSKQGG